MLSCSTDLSGHAERGTVYYNRGTIYDNVDLWEFDAKIRIINDAKQLKITPEEVEILEIQIQKVLKMNINKGKFKLHSNIEYREKIYLLSVTVTNISEITLEFDFTNHTGSFARNCIQLYDCDKNINTFRGVELMSTKSFNNELTQIKPQESATFILKGKIENIEEDLFLTFKGVNFLVEKEKRYFVEINFLDTTSGLIPFTIE